LHSLAAKSPPQSVMLHLDRVPHRWVGVWCMVSYSPLCCDINCVLAGRRPITALGAALRLATLCPLTTLRMWPTGVMLGGRAHARVEAVEEVGGGLRVPMQDPGLEAAAAEVEAIDTRCTIAPLPVLSPREDGVGVGVGVGLVVGSIAGAGLGAEGRRDEGQWIEIWHVCVVGHGETWQCRLVQPSCEGRIELSLFLLVRLTK
jgi:hypothetical protein